MMVLTTLGHYFLSLLCECVQAQLHPMFSKLNLTLSGQTLFHLAASIRKLPQTLVCMWTELLFICCKNNTSIVDTEKFWTLYPAHSIASLGGVR